MAQRSLAERVNILEQKVSKLELLPSEVAALRREFGQFRSDNHGEHSAIREEIAALGAALRTEIRAGDEETRHQARLFYEDLRGMIKTLGEGMPRARRKR